ncbi:UNVERIFIED_CONTAM: hypothetical protein Sradi_6253400 [Sesamum radiatum]|uniref:Uncharacterized protein n=1 Tax=Sesamum radiatum TaxID=300843 RepID=A0AAW2KBS4_SESRA
MITLAWNCRGLGGSWTVRKLGDYFNRYKPSLVFLNETKCNRRRFEVIKNKVNMSGVEVPPRGQSGGLMLLWHKEVDVQLCSFSVRHIDVDIIGVEFAVALHWEPQRGIVSAREDGCNTTAVANSDISICFAAK